MAACAPAQGTKERLRIGQGAGLSGGRGPSERNFRARKLEREREAGQQLKERLRIAQYKLKRLSWRRTAGDSAEDGGAERGTGVVAMTRLWLNTNLILHRTRILQVSGRTGGEKTRSASSGAPSIACSRSTSRPIGLIKGSDFTGSESPD